MSETTAPDGSAVLKTNRYTELADGMHYQNQNGDWLESKEIIDIVPGGGLASQGPHKVGFAANINTAGAIHLLTPDGKRLRSHVLGLAYLDIQTGKSVWIAGIKDSIGELIGDNQILYRDAFNAQDFKADIQYFYTRAGLQQNVIFRPGGTPALPEAYGMNSASVRLEVITEFIESVAPAVTETTLLPGFVDQRLDFGGMYMTAGHAFQINGETEDPSLVPTGKTWEQKEGRVFLVEAVQYPAVKPYLDALGVNAAAKQPRNAFPAARAGRTFPHAPQQARRATDNLRMAALPINGKEFGFVIDYSIFNGSTITNYTFAADRTYYVSGSSTLWGTNNVIEGSTVIKFTNTFGTQLRFHQGINCQTSPFRPAVFTSMHDDTVGDVITGSTGNPTNYCAYAMLWLGNSAGGYFNLHDLRVLHAYRAFYGTTKVNADISNCQIVHANIAFKNNTAFWNLRNVLLSDVLSAITGVTPLTNNAEHVTFFAVSNLVDSGLPAIKLTNSILIGVTNGVSYSGTSVETNLSGTGIFETGGFGAHYLVTNSPYLAVGTTNINPALLASLRQRTTFPPQVLTNTTTTTNLILGPVVARDTNAAPSLGYHYDVLDYFVSGLTVTNATVIVTNGAAVGFDYFTGSWGVILKNSKFISQGNALNLNHIVRSHMVQERSGGNPGTRALFYDGASSGSSNEMRMRFTFFSQLVNDGYMLYTGQKFSDLEWTHSAIHNPSLVVDTAGGNFLTCGVTNTLFERGGGQFGLSSSSANVTAHARNNLFRNFTQHFVDAKASWTVNDNLIDTGGLDNHGVAITNIYNAYYQAVTNLSGGTSNRTLTNLAYVVGPLANYYQPTNSSLLHAGTVSANLVGLFHFTSTTNQVKMTNSVVNIGPHWVAVDANGNPTDTDGEGLADHLEDGNGNGVADTNETSFLLADTDEDKLTDAQELDLGYNPLLSDTGSTGRLDGDKDFDSDGISNELEYRRFFSDPKNSHTFSSTSGDKTYLLKVPVAGGPSGDSLAYLRIYTGPLRFRLLDAAEGLEYDLYFRETYDLGSYWRLQKRFIQPDTDYPVDTSQPQGFWEAYVASDTDKDGLPDGYELLVEGEIADNSADGAKDYDDDGYSNAEEFHARTDPEAADAHLEITWTMTRSTPVDINDEIIKGPGYRILYHGAPGDNANGIFKISFDQRHRNLPLKDWDEALGTGGAGFTQVALTSAPNGVTETWKVRYNYRKVVVFKDDVEVTSSSLGHPLPDWVDNITERIGDVEDDSIREDPDTLPSVSSVSVAYSGITVPCDYQWEGIIGNHSTLPYGPTCHAAFRPIKKMVINPGTSDAFYIVGYNEGGFDVMHFKTGDADDPNNTDDPQQVLHRIGALNNVVNFADDIAIRNSSGGTSGTMLLWLKRVGTSTIERYDLTTFALESTTTATFPSEPALPTGVPNTGNIIARAEFIHSPSDPPKDRFAVYRKATDQVFVYKRKASPNQSEYEFELSIGKANGYADGSDVRYPTTTPPQNDTDFKDNVRLDGVYWEDLVGNRGYKERAALCYDKNGRLWVSDTATARTLRFTAEGNHDGTVIAWAPKTYAMSVDSLQPTRAFNGYLEYEIDYSKELSEAGAWKLVRYWGHEEPRGDDTANGLVSVRKFSNNKTYAIAYNNSAQSGGTDGRGRVVILGNDGLIGETTLSGSTKLEPLTTFEEDRSILSVGVPSRTLSTDAVTASFKQRTFTGYSGDTPTFGAATEIGSVTATGSDPAKLIFKKIGDNMIAFYPDNVIILCPSDPCTGETRTEGWHLGAVQQTTPASHQPWLWRASPTGVSDGLGTFELHQEGADVPFGIMDENIFAISRGEDYRDAGQINQILHYRSDGTFLGQFGLPQLPGTLPLAPGAGNNLQAIGVAKVDGVIYVYTTEENFRGLHRWKLVNQ